MADPAEPRKRASTTSRSASTPSPVIATVRKTRGDDIVAVRFRAPAPARTIGLAWRPTSPRGDEFRLLGRALVPGDLPRAKTRRE